MKRCRDYIVLPILLASFVCARVQADSPRDALLRLVPDGVTMCIVVNQPHKTLTDVWNGPVVEAICKSSLGEMIRNSPEVAQLRALEPILAQQLQVELGDVFEKVFGDALILAYEAGPPGKPDQERGVFLTWSRDPKFLSQVLERLDIAQKQSGELKDVRTLEHNGRSYQHRIKSKGPDDFLFVNGSIVALSAQESMIHAVINRTTARNANSSPISEKLNRLGCADAVATAWFNPRSFEGELSLKALSAKGSEAVFLRSFADAWKALDGIALAVRVEEHLEFSLAANFHPNQLPQPIRKLFANPQESSQLWTVFPSSPLLAVSGRIDFRQWIEALLLFLSPDAAKSAQLAIEQALGPAFGKKLLARLPDLLGPDFGVCITRPKDTRQLSPDIFAALRVRAEPNDPQLQQIVGGFDALLTMLRLDYNAKHSDVLTKKTLRENDVEVNYLEGDGDWPAALKPSFGLKDGYIVFASDPRLVFAFRKPMSYEQTHETPLLVASFREWDLFLKDRRMALAAIAARSNDKSQTDAENQIDLLRSMLAFMDRLEVVLKPTDAGQIRLSARLRFTSSLKRK